MIHNVVLPPPTPAPDGPPMDVTLQPVTSQSIQVTWKVSEIESIFPEMPLLLFPPQCRSKAPAGQLVLLSCHTYACFSLNPVMLWGKRGGYRSRSPQQPPLLYSFLHPGSLMETCAWGGMKNLAVPSREGIFFTTLACPPNPTGWELDLILCKVQGGPVDDGR